MVADPPRARSNKIFNRYCFRCDVFVIKKPVSNREITGSSRTNALRNVWNNLNNLDVLHTCQARTGSRDIASFRPKSRILKLSGNSSAILIALAYLLK